MMVDDAACEPARSARTAAAPSTVRLNGQVTIGVGTLSKAVGRLLGSYVAVSPALREILIERARPFLFFRSGHQTIATACIEAIRIMQSQPELHERLWANTHRFPAEIGTPGFDIGHSQTPITPVILGDSELTIAGT